MAGSTRYTTGRQAAAAWPAGRSVDGGEYPRRAPKHALEKQRIKAWKFQFAAARSFFATLR